MNKTLLSGLLGILFLCFSDLSAQNTCFSAWRYVVDIPVSNPNGLTQTDFQIKVDLDTQTLIGAGKMNADGSDLRFTGSDCCSELPYFIQSGLNTASTVIWVKVPVLPPFGNPFSITMYYGNSAANTIVSNIDSVLSSIGTDSTGTGTAPIDTTVATEAYSIPIDGRTVRWRIYSQGAGDITLKIFNDTNKVNGSSPLFSLPAGPGFTFIDWEGVSVPGAHVGFHTLDNLGMMTSCTPVTPCPGSCGDLVFEPGNLFPPAGEVDQVTCGAFPNFKVWYRKLLFIDPSTSIGAELDRTTPFMAAATGSTTFCIGDSVELTAMSINAPSYQWFNNGTLIPGATDTIYMALDSGHFYCVAFWAPCQTLTSDTIEVTAITPVIDLGPDRVVCSDTGEVLDAGSGFVSYLWSDNSTGSTLLATTSGTYYVAVTDSNNCTFSDTVDLVIQPLPNPVIVPSDSVTICEGESVTLEAYDPSWYAYQWNLNSVTSSDLTVDSTGSYYVIVFDSLLCSDTSAAVMVNVVPAPIVDLGPDTTICENAEITFDISSGNWATILWSDMSTGTEITVNLAGGYSVQVTDANGCGARDTVVLGINPVATVNIGNDITLCAGATAALDAGAGFTTYAWSNGESSQNIVANAGTYQVVVTDANGCQASSNLVTISEFPVLPNPVVSGDQSQVMSTDQPNYQWYFGGSPIAGANNQTLVPLEPGIYQVSTDDPNGCGTVFSNELLVVFGLTQDDIPEGFSPNGDGINDNFVIRNIDLFPQNVLSIRNRWGNSVFEAGPYNNTFNGNSAQGSRLPDGTYFYILDPGNGDDKLSGYLIINR